MKPAAFHIETFGCQMNERDSEIMALLLERAGLERATDVRGARVAVVNTCHIRDHATNRALSYAGRLREWKGGAPGRVLVFAGCVAEAEGTRLLPRFPHADVVLGPAFLGRLPGLVERALAGGAPVVLTGAGDGGVPEAQVPAAGAFRASLKVMEGCSCRCAYCVVPFVRGAERHRPLAEITAEAERLAREGVKEVLLLGQAVNAWRDPGAPEKDFASLLRAMRGTPLARVRFISSHPRFLGDAQIGALAEGGNLCEHLHLPVQTGSDRILAAMGRGHNAAEYRVRVEAARAAVPGLAVTTDFMVGFPGETEEDFRSTLELARSAGFAGGFAFKFSPRPGTPAASLPGQAAEEEKEERLSRLLAALDGASLAYNRSQVGREAEVLVEGPAEKGGMWKGRTRTGRLVLFERGDAAPGELRGVAVTAAGTWTLSGTLARVPAAGRA